MKIKSTANNTQSGSGAAVKEFHLEELPVEVLEVVVSILKRREENSDGK